MPRNSGGANVFIDGNCKIRKRVCSSPSSTPSVLKNYRFKRAILAPKKRGGSSTSVPTWIINAKSPSSAASFSRKSHHKQSKSGHRGSQTSISARKLANAVWKLNKFPSPKKMEELQERRSKKETIRTSGKLRSLKQGSLSHLSDPSHSPASELTYGFRSSTKMKMLPLIYPSLHPGNTSCVPSDMMSSASFMEMEAHSQSIATRSSITGINSHLKELKKNLITLKELVKLLDRFLEPSHQHPSIVALASALDAQLDQAFVQINHLIKERSKQNEIGYLKYFAIEKDSRRTKEQERTTTIFHCIKELAAEKKLRRRAERMNKNLGIELSQMKTSLLKSAGELGKERKTREVIERVCTEMVREIGHDKAKVEELKKHSFRVREELENEREMLHLANELREERVHMKLSEAKFQFEEKNAAVDKLRNELEAFLTTKRSEMVKNDQDQLHATRAIRCTNMVVDREESQQRDDGTDSEDFELHSIELNMDSNENGYRWNHAAVTFENEDELVPTKNNESNCICSEARKNNYSLDGNMAVAKYEFVENSQCLRSELVQGELTDDKDQKLDQDAKRCLSVIGPRDKKSLSSKIILPRTIPSPIKRWSKQQTLHHSISQFSEGSKVNEMLKAIRDS